jgi:hypothetical protein
MLPAACCLDECAAALLANGAPAAVSERKVGERHVADVWPKGCVPPICRLLPWRLATPSLFAACRTHWTTLHGDNAPVVTLGYLVGWTMSCLGAHTLRSGCGQDVNPPKVCATHCRGLVPGMSRTGFWWSGMPNVRLSLPFALSHGASRCMAIACMPLCYRQDLPSQHPGDAATGGGLHYGSRQPPLLQRSRRPPPDAHQQQLVHCQDEPLQ